MDKLKQFTVRVYGILVDKGRILLSHEKYHNKRFTKFPGGGLELGESVLDCLKREFMEEMGVEIIPSYLFHVTESVQVSSFYPEDQVIAIYYIVQCDEVENIKVSVDPKEIPDRSEIFQWVKLSEFSKDMLTFESEKEAASKLFDKQTIEF